MGLNILVVDDSSVMRSVIRKTLNMTGLPLGDIWEAKNGEEGLRLLQEKRVDLALVDIHMPVMDGEEMINKLRDNEQYKDLPVIIISSESDPRRIEMMHRRATIFIHKPFKPETLKEVMVAATGVSNEKED
ncbi:MAG: response regulator [Syntrophaceae bacterium]|nr:response regulator [Syntrophaceae bacterium]